MLYILDEPSTGLHPFNVDGLMKIVHEFVERKISVVLVDHDPRMLSEADELIEIGPGSGKDGGRIVAQGTPAAAMKNPASRIGPYLSGEAPFKVRETAKKAEVFAKGEIRMKTKPLYTVHALEVSIPKGRLTVVTGVSGAGKTSLVIECLVPALRAKIQGTELPSHVAEIEAEGINSET